MDEPLWKISILRGFINRHFSLVEWPACCVRLIRKPFFRTISLKKEKIQNLQGLSSFEDINVFIIKKLTFFLSRMALLPYKK